MQQKINFRQERDFGQVFGVALTFMKQNFKPLFGAILLLAGPFILVFGVLMGVVQSRLNNLGSTSFMYGSALGVIYNMLALLAVAVLLLLIGAVVLHTVVNEYMLLYKEREDDRPITLSEIASRTWRSLWRVLGAYLILFLITVVVCFIFGWMMVVLASGAPLMAGLMIFFLVIALLLTGPVLSYWVYSAIYLVVRDDANVFEALGNSRYYLRNNYWWTWLLLFVSGLAVAVASLIFSAPAGIVNFISSLSRIRHLKEGIETGGEISIVYIVLYTFGQLCSSMLRCFILLISNFQYLSLEEKTEGKGLMDRINEIQ